MRWREFRASYRGESSAVSYIIILVLVAGVAAGSLTVVNSVDSALESPSPANTEIEVDQDYDRVDLVYEGQIEITEGNTDIIEITNGSSSVYINASGWNDTAGSAIASGETFSENITSNNFQEGEVVDIIHYSEAEKTDSGTIDTDESGTRLETITLEQRQPRTLNESIAIDEGDQETEDTVDDGNDGGGNDGGGNDGGGNDGGGNDGGDGGDLNFTAG